VAQICDSNPLLAIALAMLTAIISAPPGLRESMSCMTFSGLMVGMLDCWIILIKFTVYAVKIMFRIVLFHLKRNVLNTIHVFCSFSLRHW